MTDIYTDRTDEQLMQAYLQGDDAAFREIFRRHSGRIRGLIRRSRVADDVASDLLQQTFLQLHRARNDFDDTRKLRPYLVTIAMNLVRGHYRKLKRTPETVEFGSTPDREGRDEAIGTQRIENADVAARVRHAVSRLPAKQRSVIELHWFEGLSMSEISDQVGASLSAVKVRAHRGYERLRGSLSPELFAA